MQKSGGEKTVVFRQISPYVSIIPEFWILIERFKNLLNKALRKVGCLDISSIVKTKVAEFAKK